jgi:hypothetical protein
LTLSYAATGLEVDKTCDANESGLSVTYNVHNSSDVPHDYTLAVESRFNPSLRAITDHDRGSAAYWDGTDTTMVVPPAVTHRDGPHRRTRLVGAAVRPLGPRVGPRSHPDPDILLLPLARRAEVPDADAGLGDDVRGIRAARRPFLSTEVQPPEPLDATTSVDFSLPHEGRVTLRVFDVGGRLVPSLVDEEFAAGTHTLVWNRTDDHGTPVASSVYSLRLSHSGSTATRKAVLLKWRRTSDSGPRRSPPRPPTAVTPPPRSPLTTRESLDTRTNARIRSGPPWLARHDSPS